ncbi:MAG TPA: ribosome silencing factor [Abditibacteriaceae bacterium]|jgi:ribosome-associated protein
MTFELEEQNGIEQISTEQSNLDIEGKVRLICAAAEDIKARDIVYLDVRGQTIVSDFFVVCSGTSITHIQSIAEGVKDRLREEAKMRARPEGDAQSYWMILDYGDVILHIFSDETREFYDLERLWSDAKATRWATENDTPSTRDATDDNSGEQA